MAVTTLPVRSETAGSGQVAVGQTKTSSFVYTNTDKQWSADHFNNAMNSLVAVAAEVGLTDGSTAGSFNEMRHAEIIAASGEVRPGFNIVSMAGGNLTLELPAAVAGRVTHVTLQPINTGGGNTLKVKRNDSVAFTSELWTAGKTESLTSPGVTLPGWDAPFNAGEANAYAATWHLYGFTDGSTIEYWFAAPAPSYWAVEYAADGFRDVKYTSGTSHTVTTERLLYVDTSGGAVTINLPAVSAVQEGRSVRIIKTNTGTNGITIDPSGSEEVRGPTSSGTTFVLTNSTVAQRGSWEVTAERNNTRWYAL